jgi:hypothetical protein
MKCIILICVISLFLVWSPAQSALIPSRSAIPVVKGGSKGSESKVISRGGSSMQMENTGFEMAIAGAVATMVSSVYNISILFDLDVKFIQQMTVRVRKCHNTHNHTLDNSPHLNTFSILLG